LEEVPSCNVQEGLGLLRHAGKRARGLAVVKLAMIAADRSNVPFNPLEAREH
jgi:hypothetical protein